MWIKPASDVAFSEAVKAVQTRRGSRAAYARQEASGSWQTTVTPDLAAFIAAQTSVFLGTASAAGPPQHPASRQAARLSAGAGGPNAGLRRSGRKPAIHHHREPCREPEGASVPDRPGPAAADQAVGHRPRGRGRRGPAGRAGPRRAGTSGTAPPPPRPTGGRAGHAAVIARAPALGSCAVLRASCASDAADP